MFFSLVLITPSGALLNLSFNEYLLFALKIIIGTLVGLIYVFIGIFLFRNYTKWRESVEFLVGDGLTKGTHKKLFISSVIAGVYEEGYTRGLFLFLYYYNYPNLIFATFVVNSLWALSHLLNIKSELADSFKITFNKALPHMILIFLSGIPWFFITMATKSLVPAIISHFLLDFLMGIYVRRNIN